MRVAANVITTPEPKMEENPHNMATSTTITAEQYKHLMNILQNVQVTDGVQNIGASSATANATFAGIFASCFMSCGTCTCLSSMLSSDV